MFTGERCSGVFLSDRCVWLSLQSSQCTVGVGRLGIQSATVRKGYCKAEVQRCHSRTAHGTLSEVCCTAVACRDADPSTQFTHGVAGGPQAKYASASVI